MSDDGYLTISSTLQLPDEGANAPATRTVIIELGREQSQSRDGDWWLVANASDSRLKLSSKQGKWRLSGRCYDDHDETNLDILTESRTTMVAQLKNIDSEFVRAWRCGVVYSGSGSIRSTTVKYRCDVLCV